MTRSEKIFYNFFWHAQNSTHTFGIYCMQLLYVVDKNASDFLRTFNLSVLSPNNMPLVQNLKHHF